VIVVILYEEFLTRAILLMTNIPRIIRSYIEILVLSSSISI